MRKQIDRTKGILYKYKNKYFLKLPSGVRVTKVFFDKEMNKNVALCKDRNPLLGFNLLLAFSFILCMINIYIQKDPISYNMAFESTMQSDGEYIELNLTSDSSSKYCTDVALKTKSGRELVCIKGLKPGESVGTVKSNTLIQKGSHVCDLIVTVDKDGKNVEKDFNVLVVVK